MRRPLHVAIVFLLCLGPIATSMGAATEPGATAILVAQAEVSIEGQANFTATGGLHFTNLSNSQFNASADVVEVQTHWETGYLTEAPTGEYRQVTDTGTSYHNTTRAELSFSTPKQPGELLLVPDSGFEIHSEIPKRSTVAIPGDGTLIAWGGYSDESVESNGGAPRFAYHSNESLLSVTPVEDSRFEGSGKLFVNDAVLKVEDNTNEWSTWTGFRAEETAPGIQEYELRVTTVTVEALDGYVKESSDMSLLSDSLDGDWSGFLRADRATGTVNLGPTEVNLEAETAELSGEGDIQISSGPSPWRTDGTALVTETHGGFELRSEPLQSPTPNAGGGKSSSGLWLFGIALLGTFVMVGFRIGTPAVHACLPSQARERLYNHWEARAKRSVDEGRREQAAKFYGRMTRVFPSRTHAWYGYAVNLIEARKPADAIMEIEKARGSLNEVPLDFLELEVAAAAQAGDVSTARSAFSKLAEASPSMAKRLTEEVRLRGLEHDPVIQRILAETCSKGGSVSG